MSDITFRELLDERNELRAKLAALEDAANKAATALRDFSREATHPTAVTAEMIALGYLDSALTAHAGALAAHDARVRATTIQDVIDAISSVRAHHGHVEAYAHGLRAALKTAQQLKEQAENEAQRD
jgi:hypothetical protein